MSNNGANLFSLINPKMHSVVLIDGANNQMAFQKMQERPDWRKIYNIFCGNMSIAHMKYYTATKVEEDGFNQLQKLLDFMSYNGYILCTKEAKTYSNNGSERTKGNMDIEIAVDMLLAAKYAQQIVLFSGDGDFCYAINHVQQLGVRVVAVSNHTPNNGGVVADALRKQVDAFVNLVDFRELFCQRADDK